MEHSLAHHIIKYRWIYFCISLLTIIYSAYGITKFRFDADPSLYFSDDDVHMQAYDVLEEQYGRVDSVVFALHIKEGELYTQENLAILEELSNEAWSLPYARRVDSLSNYSYSYAEDDDLIVDELINNSLQLSDNAVARIKSIALSDPSLVNRLSTDKGEVAIATVSLALPYIDRVSEEKEATYAARDFAKKFEEKYPHIDIAVSGNVVSNTSVNDRAIDDSKVLVPLMYLIIFAMLGYFLRSVSAVIVVAFIVMASVLATLGLASHFGVVVNLLSITAINIIITVSIAHCVHLLVLFLTAYRQGRSKSDAIIESYRINLQPIFLTSLTTAIGFLSMNLSDMPPAHDLGNMAALGVTVAFVLSLTILPLMTILLPFSKGQSETARDPHLLSDNFSNFIINHRHAILLVTIISSLTLVALSTQNEINDRFTESLKRPAEFRVDNDFIDQYFGGLYTIEYSFAAKDGENISSIEYLTALDNFTQWLRAQPYVSNVHSYADVIKRLNKNMHGDDPAYYRIPDSQAEAAQYLLLFESSQPFGSDMSNYIQADHSATKLIVAFPSMDSQAVIRLREEYFAWIQNNMPAYMHHSGASLSVMWSYIGGDAFTSSLKGALFALLLISLTLTFIFKSVRYGIISLIPNLLPAGVGYGIWAIYSGYLDMSQMMVLSITIGIVVDDTVHFLSKYLRAKRELGADAMEAVRFAFRHVGRALWITTVVLVAGFGLLITSSFVPNSNLGLLTAMILLTALALDFFLLPPLLMLLDKDKKN